MDAKKIVVVVEDLEVARTALLWALHNLIRYGDVITLLHVFPAMKTRSKKKLRLRRLKGFQLALSFKEICNKYSFNTNVEIVVAEGDENGSRIASMVREIGASTLVVGLHDQSFLYNTRKMVNCLIVFGQFCEFQCTETPWPPAHGLSLVVKEPKVLTVIEDSGASD
ncbi:hypothetical protein Pint_16393 [Pistacia integerrima]|uniref:Uncharacterized protein n=1 Tax=Pistacia integerrima TaxID=434235 RepID=A0ACC0Z7U2_9ROSI|nr:hypothetical protein Pint_16393 [Pistacia integerrima]